MATGTAYGTNYALKAAPRVGTWPNAAICNSELYCLSEEAYSTAAGDAGSFIYLGKLPAGAVVQFCVVWPIDTATYGEGDNATAAGLTMEIGTSSDPDLFGDVTDLNASALPQVIGVCPDGTTYTTTLDFALRSETTVLAKTGGAALTTTEGIAIKIFYTMAGRTYS